MSTTPGWYADPAPGSAPGSLRWWDGGRWTEQTQVPQQQPPAASQVQLTKPVTVPPAQPVAPGTTPRPGQPVPLPGGHQGAAAAPPAQLTHTPDGLTLASPWKRLGAQVIDGLIIFAVVVAVELVLLAVFAGAGALLFGTGGSAGTAADAGATAGIVLAVVVFVLGLLAFQYWYFIHRVRKVGATLGKQVLGLRIRTFHTDGQLTWGQVWGRFGLVQLASGFTGGLLGIVDALWLFWDRHRQTLHDKTVGTVVVDTSAPRLPHDHPAVQYARASPAARGWVADGPNPQTPATYPR